MSSTMEWSSREVTVDAAVEKNVLDAGVLLEDKLEDPINAEEYLKNDDNQNTETRIITEEDEHLLLDDEPLSESVDLQNQKELEDELLGDSSTEITNGIVQNPTISCSNDNRSGELAIEDLLRKTGTDVICVDYSKNSDHIKLANHPSVGPTDNAEIVPVEDSPNNSRMSLQIDEEEGDVNAARELVFKPQNEENHDVDDEFEQITSIDSSMEHDALDESNEGTLMIENFIGREECPLPADVRSMDSNNIYSRKKLRKAYDPDSAAGDLLDSVIDQVASGISSTTYKQFFGQDASLLKERQNYFFMTTFDLFVAEVRTDVMNKNPRASEKEIGQLIASEWNLLPIEKKKEYEGRAVGLASTSTSKTESSNVRKSFISSSHQLEPIDDVKGDLEEGTSTGSSRRKKGFGLTRSEIRRFVRASMDSLCVNRQCLKERLYYQNIIQIKDEALREHWQQKDDEMRLKAKVGRLAADVQQFRNSLEEMQQNWKKERNWKPYCTGMAQQINSSSPDTRLNKYQQLTSSGAVAKVYTVQKGVAVPTSQHSLRNFPSNYGIVVPSTSSAGTGKTPMAPSVSSPKANIIMGSAKTQVPLAARPRALATITTPLKTNGIINYQDEEPLVKRAKGRPPLESSNGGIYTHQSASSVLPTISTVSKSLKESVGSYVPSSSGNQSFVKLGSQINGRTIERLEKRSRVNIRIERFNRDGKFSPKLHPLAILQSSSFIPFRRNFEAGPTAWSKAPEIHVITTDDDFFISKKVFGEVKYSNVPLESAISLIYYMKSQIDNRHEPGCGYKIASVFYPNDTGRTKFCVEYLKDYEFWGDDILYMTTILHTPEANLVGKMFMYDIPEIYRKIGQNRQQQQLQNAIKNQQPQQSDVDNSEVVVKEIPAVSNGEISERRRSAISQLDDGFEMYIPPQ